MAIFFLLEYTITSLPLLLIIVSVILILYKELWVMHIAFIAGLILDIASVRPLGSSSALLVAWLFLILLYERKYKIDSYPFVAVSSFFGAIIFLILFNYPNIISQAVISSIFALVLFSTMKRMKHI